MSLPPTRSRALAPAFPLHPGAMSFSERPPPEARREGLRPVNTPVDRPSNTNTRQAEAEDDRELVEAARGGDRQAFRALVERHQRRAYAIAFSLLRDESDAAEVVQEAFLRVYRGLATFQGGSSFFTWLYRIVTNLAIDVLRRPGRQTDELDEGRGKLDESDENSFPLLARVDGADPLDAMHRAELAGAIKAALDALPPYHRGVIVMREVEGLSYEEMAQAMGVSKGTIMSRLFHARQKLQRALSAYYQEGQRTAVASAPADEGSVEEGGEP
jgi:RNA polymerase sigma-70 factor, ECF subfamily